MGTSRELKESEKIFRSIFGDFLNINNCVWFGGKHMKEEVRELIPNIKRKLDALWEEFEKE